MKPCWSGLHKCVETTLQSMVLFFWRKLMSLLRPSVTTILQHPTDGYEAGRKGKWYFPWVLTCSSNQNSVRSFTTFFMFSLDMTLLSKRSLSLGSQKWLLNRWLDLGKRQPLLARRRLKDIFKVNEFGMFYKTLPSKSLHFRSKRFF